MKIVTERVVVSDVGENQETKTKLTFTLSEGTVEWATTGFFLCFALLCLSLGVALFTLSVRVIAEVLGLVPPCA